MFTLVLEHMLRCYQARYCKLEEARASCERLGRLLSLLPWWDASCHLVLGSFHIALRWKFSWKFFMSFCFTQPYLERDRESRLIIAMSNCWIMLYWIILSAYSCQIESVSPSSTVVCYKYEHDSMSVILQIWNLYSTLDCWILAAIARNHHHQDVWSLLDRAKPVWYLNTTLIITVSFLQLSHVASSCKLERECRDSPRFIAEST